MVGSRAATAAVGLLASLAISVVAWVYFDSLLLFLFVPFVPFLFRGFGGDERAQETPSVKECPTCGFQTADDEFDYCPRDGRRLDRQGGRR
jgi:hypothetical protein